MRKKLALAVFAIVNSIAATTAAHAEWDWAVCKNSDDTTYACCVQCSVFCDECQT